MGKGKLVFSLAFLMLLMSSLVSSEVDNKLFNYHSLGLEFTLTNDFTVRQAGKSFYLESVSAELSWYPLEDYRQKPSYINTVPGAEFYEGRGFVFTWEKPSETRFVMRQESLINTKNEFLEVKEKVPFPIKDLDPDYAHYLKPREITDINDKMIDIAAGLARDESDLYKVASKIAFWVEDNVEYNLSTMTSDAAQKSSWVLENKQGVCDEITSLFISLCRSIGIPARFVTGVSYSNINQQNDGWGPHGWAEVYFPGYGWVPFDVTYKEMGYIDATHIKLKVSEDTKESSTEYLVRGNDADINPGNLEFGVTVKSRNYPVKPSIYLYSELNEPSIGFGSYNLLTVSAENPTDYYMTARLGLSRVEGVTVLSSEHQNVVLAPGEKKKLFWLFRIEKDFDPSYVYTFPLKVTNNRGEETNIKLKADRDSKVFSEKYMRSFILDYSKKEKKYSSEIIVACSADKKEMFLNDTVQITCELFNRAGTSFPQVNICFDSECAQTRLDAGEKKNFGYAKKFDTLGVKTLQFTAENPLFDKSYYVVIDIQDKPMVEITSVSFPERVAYNDSVSVTLKIKRKSTTPPRNLRIMLDNELIKQEWTLSSLESEYEFRVLLKGSDLNVGQNDFKVSVSYEDEQKTVYSAERDFSMTLERPTPLQRFAIWFNVLDVRITSWLADRFRNI